MFLDPGVLFTPLWVDGAQRIRTNCFPWVSCIVNCVTFSISLIFKFMKDTNGSLPSSPLSSFFPFFPFSFCLSWALNKENWKVISFLYILINVFILIFFQTLMSLVFEKFDSENLFTAGKSIASARVKMQEIAYLWDFSSQWGNATWLMVYFPSFFPIIKMLISEDQIFTKTKAMVFSKDGDIEKKMKVVQLQLAHQWSALPKCRSLVLNLGLWGKGSLEGPLSDHGEVCQAIQMARYWELSATFLQWLWTEDGAFHSDAFRNWVVKNFISVHGSSSLGGRFCLLRWEVH